MPVITDLITPDGDILYAGDTALRYLGHSKAKYGFILVSPPPIGELQFIFDINPQSIEMDEPAATSIRPTQGGGKFIENQGSILKDITITGQTGFLPRKGIDRDIFARSAYAQGALTSIESLLARVAYSKVSGYDAFHRLRALFRKYWDIHRNSPDVIRNNTRFYWLNTKDDEVWQVEPMSFHMSRAVPRTMTYGYNIRITTLAKGWGAFAPVPADFSDLAQNPIGAVLSTIRSRIDDANTILRRGMGLLQSLRGIQSQIMGILAVGTTISSALKDVASGVKEFLDFPATLLASVTTTISGIYTAAEELLVDLPIDVLEGLVSLDQEYDHLGARLRLFAPDWSTKWGSAVADFNRQYGIQGDASEPLDAGHRHDEIGESTSQKGEDITQFAARVTGDASRWHEIVTLNGLRWPYLSPTADSRLPGTVAPGDPLLVPLTGAGSATGGSLTATTGLPPPSVLDDVLSASPTTLTRAGIQAWRPDMWVGFTVEIVSGLGVGQTRLVVSNTVSTLTVDLTWTTQPNSTSVFKLYFKSFKQVPRKGADELLGSDIQLIYDTTRKLWTFAVNASGDLQTIQGKDNLKQAIDIKLNTSQGALALYPWFGLHPITGMAGTAENLMQARLHYEEMLLSDSRVESVEKLSFELIQDVLTVSAELLLKGGTRSTYASPMV